VAELLTFRALGLLLTYPREELVASVPALRDALRGERVVPVTLMRSLESFLREIETAELLDLQEQYVGLFDRRRALSLYLYEHLHGDSRDRGQAMVDLRSAYERHGLTGAERELPDYLPLYCEFLSLIPLDAAKASLGDTRPILDGLAARLEERRSPYASVVRCLVALATVKNDAVRSRSAVSDDSSEMPSDGETDLEALDRQWEEQAVTFGVAAAHDSCRSPARSDGLVQLGTRPRGTV